MARVFNTNLEKATINNNNYRKVIYTSSDKHMQLVLMSLKPKEEIGKEIHPKTIQFFRIEQGNGIAIIGNREIKLTDGSLLIVPANTYHNIINTGDTDLKLYTIYIPAHHPDKLVQVIKIEDKGGKSIARGYKIH